MLRRADDSYAEVEVNGKKVWKTYCPFTCDKCCGRACRLLRGHRSRCDCRTDCASTIGPFDHLTALAGPQAPGVVPVELLDEHDTDLDLFHVPEEPTR